MTDPLRVTVECWENQRHHPTKGWGPHRLPVDRPLWSNKKGDAPLHRESFLTPVGWVWVTPWAFAANGPNADGWYYAADFSLSTRFARAAPNAFSLVRRRRWVRTRAPFPDHLRRAPTAVWRAVWLSTVLYGADAPVAAQRVSTRAQHSAFAALSSGRERRRCAYRFGLPQCLRPSVWAASVCPAAKPVHTAPPFPTAREISQDVRRTAARHPLFAQTDGAEALRSVLVALDADDGLPPYHQAFSYVAAVALLQLPPREAQAVVTALLRTLLPAGYHAACRVQNDVRIYKELLRAHLADVHRHLQERRIDAGVFASGWLQGIFCAHFPVPTAARVLDVIFVDGESSVMVRFLIAFTRRFRKEFLTMDSSGSLGQFANEWARECFDVDDLMLTMEADGLASIVLSRREELALEDSDTG